MGDRAAQPRRAAQQRAAGVGRDRWARSPRPALLAAERHRTRTGEGQLRPARALRRRVRDGRQPRPHRRGAARRPRPAARTATTSTARSATTSSTRDGRRVMVVALTAPPVDTRCVDGTGIGEACQRIEQVTGHDLDTEAGRFEARDLIAALLRPWFAARDARRGARGVRRHRRLVGPVPDVPPAGRARTRAARPPTRCSPAVEQPGVGTYLMPGSPLDFSAAGRLPAATRAAARRAHRRDPGRRARARRGRDRPAARRWDGRRRRGGRVIISGSGGVADAYPDLAFALALVFVLW